MFSGDITLHDKDLTWNAVAPESQTKITSTFEEEGIRYNVSLSRSSSGNISGVVDEIWINPDGTTFLDFTADFIVH